MPYINYGQNLEIDSREPGVRGVRVSGEVWPGQKEIVPFA